MEEHIPAHVEQLARDVYERSIPYRRKEAAEALGKLTKSNLQVVAALVAARDFDSDAEVRQAAADALSSPVHQTLLEQNAETIKQMAAQLKMRIDRDRQSKTNADSKKRAKGKQSSLIGLLVVAGAVFYPLLRGIPLLTQYSNPGNPYESALLREGTLLTLWGIFGLVVLGILIFLHWRKYGF